MSFNVYHEKKNDATLSVDILMLFQMKFTRLYGNPECIHIGTLKEQKRKKYVKKEL